MTSVNDPPSLPDPPTGSTRPDAKLFAWWWWIIAAIVIVVIVWAMWSRPRGNQRVAPSPNASPALSHPPGDVGGSS